MNRKLSYMSMTVAMMAACSLLASGVGSALVYDYGDGTEPGNRWIDVPAGTTLKGNAPDWWDDPTQVGAGDPSLGEKTSSMRVGWTTWENATTGPKGVPGADYAWRDFDPWPGHYDPWQFSLGYNVKIPDIVDPNKGIEVPKGLTGIELDLLLPNLEAHPYKYWYFEATWLAGDPADHDKIPVRVTPEFKWYLGGDPIEPTLRYEDTGWIDHGSDYGQTYWYTVMLEPQPDTDVVKIGLGTAGFGDSLWLTDLHAGSTCTPEPAAFVLLALSGLPIAYLRRRKKKA